MGWNFIFSEPTGPVARRNRILGPAVGIVVGLGLVCGIRSVCPGKKTQSGRKSATSTFASAPQDTVTFDRDVAPIVFQKCAGCHRPGQSAPFALLTYAEVRKHARQIGEVTRRRYMPPWLPEPGYGEFAFDRRLSAEQIAIIQQWVADGAAQGDPADLTPTPRFHERWQLGKPEVVQPTIGFYFTDRGPTNIPFRVALKCFELDIPAGADNYSVEQSYLLPVDLNILRVSTHAHYLGKEMRGYAILPTGEKKWLIWIRNWDFNWQGDYEYIGPQFVPKGSRLIMHYTYDNSTNNVHNPNQPPKRVRYGLETTDEMASLLLQALPRSPQDRTLLARDYFAYLISVTIDFDHFLLRLDPENVAAHTRLGRSLRLMGKFTEATDHLLSAVRIRPGDDQAHYELALLYLTLGKTAEAEQEFLTVTRLNPYDYQAYGNLGDLYRRNGRTEEARACFETALRLNPEDPAARKYLGLLPRRPR